MKVKFLSNIFICGCLALFLALMLSPANSGTTKNWKPSSAIRIGSVTTTGTGFVSGTALYSTIEKLTGTKFSITPNSSTMARAKLLKNGKVDLIWCPGAETFFGLEGIEEFAQWGPQSFRVVYIGGPLEQGIAVRGNSGIVKLSDMKGKKVTTYPTYAVPKVTMNGAMAYANLSWDDVIPTPVAGTKAGRQALIDGAVDVAQYSVRSPQAFELEASIHGIRWLPFPNKTAEDKAAWDRYRKWNPSVFPITITTGPGTSKDNPGYCFAFNYQICAYDWTDENLVYWHTKQLHKHYDAYKDKHSYLAKFTIDHVLNTLHWYVPWHDGSVKYFKDAGLWTPEMNSKQKELLAKYPQTMTK